MAAEHDDALILRLWDWSETSQTTSIFTRGHGVIRGLAKGSRRPKAPYSGGLELLTVGEVGFIHKTSSDLSLITEWDLHESFPALHASLACHYAGLYVADVLHHVLQARDPHPELFDESVLALRSLTGAAAVMPALVRFQWSLLVHAGYRLDLAVEQGTDAVVLFFPRLGRFGSATAGGAVDGASDEAGSGPSWKVRVGTLETLRAVERVVDRAGADATGDSPPTELDVDPASASRAARLLAAYLRAVLDQHLDTVSLVFPDLQALAFPGRAASEPAARAASTPPPRVGGGEREES